MVDNNLNYTPDCYYWDKNPFLSAVCAERNDKGDCIKYTLSDGSNLPSSYNGPMGECTLVKEEMKKVLKVATICQNHAVEKGCIPPYKGNDSVYKDNNKDKNPTDKDTTIATSGCGGWREDSIHNSREAWVLADGTIILFYSGFQLFAIDVNGAKGPNKWGHDIFPLQSKGDGTHPAKLVPGGCSFVEKGGMTTTTLMKKMFNK